ncbi:hypothetical protein B0T25DRAFT_458326 [Lasiosphaeria hispida]|uniref:Ysc84 actin-binding domain-containing protein n=1 Tax=Lasiosphaeria hispida TaxID=260671 RepID=A0AAJ0MBK6_9PEZI|nr:hypothetical protein B0T25DRAFT_458326 [Lasiosphaeria hispida]
MSAPNPQKPPVIATGQEQFFPPPPGPPPAAVPQAHATQHPDSTPIPDYNIPRYDPAHPQYAEDIYDSTPTDEHPPPFPPRPNSSGKPHGHDGEGAKASWGNKLAGWGSKAAAPFNALANKMGSETFLPTTMDKECEKAARILRSFCKDGIYSDAAPQTAPAQGAPQAATTASTIDKPSEAAKAKKPRVLLTIPSKVIARAQGLAIFTTARAGFQVSGATGSGILIARLPDGSWGPPSGIQVHSVGAGFVIGIDIYDCVVVINTREALEAFTRTRMSLGSDLAVTAGPWGAGGALDFGMPQGQKGKDNPAAVDQTPPANLAAPPTDPYTQQQQQQQQHQQQPPLQPQVTTGPNTTTTPTISAPDGPGSGSSKNRKPSPFREVIKNPVYSYVKSRGFYAGVQVDGTVVTERKDANAAFYGVPGITVNQIIRGEVPPPAAVHTLFNVLKGAEGWRGQPQGAGLQPQGMGVPTRPGGAGPLSSHPPTAATPAMAGVPGVTTAFQGLNVDGAGYGAGPSTYGSAPAPPPPAVTTSAADAKAAEAAAESARHSHYSEPYGAAPPSYSEPTGAEELPPAYANDGHYQPPGGADSKTGHH